MMSNRDNQPGGGGLLVAAGAAMLLVACCALPVLIAGGVLAGIGGFLRNPWVIGTGITLVFLALVATTRRRSGADNKGHGCCPPTPATRSNHDTDTKDG